MGTALSTFHEHAQEKLAQIFTDSNNRSTLLVFLSTFLVGYYAVGRKVRKLPPGPIALPIIGNVQLAGVQSPYLYMLKLRDKYGDIISLKIGSMNAIVLFGTELIRHTVVTQGNDIANRPNWIYIIDKVFERKGVFWGNGEQWYHMRKFAVSSLRDFGVGKNSLEERILDEAVILSDMWVDFQGESFNPKPFLADAVSNIMCAIVFGERFEYTDPEFKRLLGYLEFLFQNAGLQIPENFFPWIKYIRRHSPAQKMIDNDKEIQKFVLRKVDEHRQSYDRDNLRDFIDLFLKSEEDGDTNVKVHDVFRTAVDLFLAGSEATSTAVQWFLLYMCEFPDIQNKFVDEVMEVVGNGRQVRLSDKPQLSYVMATIQEVLRIANVAPISPPHAVINPIEVGGYKLEKDDIVMFHIYSSHMDPDKWEDPHTFNPDRWIDPQGKLKHNKAYFPFGLGPRTCIGEPLVLMEFFIFTTNLLQRFEIRHPLNTPAYSLLGRQNGITNTPDPFKIQAIPRS